MKQLSSTAVLFGVAVAAVLVVAVGVWVISKVTMEPDVALWLGGSVFAFVLALFDFAKQIAIKKMFPE